VAGAVFPGKRQCQLRAETLRGTDTPRRDLRHGEWRQLIGHGRSAERRQLLQSVLLQRLRWSTYWRLVFGSSRHAFADANCNSDGKRNSNVHTNGYCHSYGYFYGHRHSYFYLNGYCYGHSHSDSHCHTNGNACTHAHTDSEAHACAKNYAWTTAAGDSLASTVTGGEHWWNGRRGDSSTRW
jgi:hypothetical protein